MLRRRKRIGAELAPQSATSYLPRISAATVPAAIGVTAFAGLRKGEIRGLWWDDDHRDMFAICRSVWNSTVKSTKTEEDMDEPGWFPIIRPLRLLLDAIKPERASGFIFLNRVGGAIDLDNLADRVIKPVFEANGMEWKGSPAYRRGLATNLKELGVEDTTIPVDPEARGREYDRALLH